MKPRHLIATGLVLFELPILAPLIVGALITGLLCGLQAAAAQLRTVLPRRQLSGQRSRDGSAAPAVLS